MNTNNANKQNIYKDKKTTHWAGKKKSIYSQRPSIPLSH